MLIDTQQLSGQTPAAQHVTTEVTGRMPGHHVYRAELENAAGVTRTEQIEVEAR